MKIFEKFSDPVPTFDDILPLVKDWLNAHRRSIESLLAAGDSWLVINRDLNGRVRLILPESVQSGRESPVWDQLSSTLMQRLGKHSYPSNSQMLFESSIEEAIAGSTNFSLNEFGNVWVVDRLATESNWASIAPEALASKRIVFFSIKGGVGRSTALAASAWHLAQAGKRVLVLDLDLESPGLSSALLPADRQPMYGITDWLVEDLVDNGDVVLESMIATSNLSHDGEIHVVPAHGASHGEYIAKLGRVWMPKVRDDGYREIWSARLERLIAELERRICPDVILIDSRSGIDEIASACITDMGANLVLLFALEGEQTWNGYRMLFEQWQRASVVEKIRERLKIVGAIVPDVDSTSYMEGLRENAYKVFGDTLYDEIAPAKPDAIGPVADGSRRWRVDELVEGWNFDEADEGAPHSPWAVSWHRSFAGLRSLQGRLAIIDRKEVESVFGPLVLGICDALEVKRSI